MSDQQIGTMVIGGSQAGLAVGYHLRQQTWLSGPDTGQEPTGRLGVFSIECSHPSCGSWRRRC